MPDLSDRGKAAMAYWGVIQRAATERMTTAELWDAIRESAEEYGLETPGVTVQGVAELRGRAAQIERLATRIDRLSATTTLGAEHIAEAPWARPLREQAGLPMYQVTFQHHFTTPEGPQSEWRTSMFHGSLPATQGDLADAIDEDGSELANKYGVAHGNVSNFRILRV